MPKPKSGRDQFITSRANSQELELLDKAACIEDRSRANFVLFHALEAARKVTA